MITLKFDGHTVTRRPVGDVWVITIDGQITGHVAHVNDETGKWILRGAVPAKWILTESGATLAAGYDTYEAMMREHWRLVARRAGIAGV